MDAGQFVGGFVEAAAAAGNLQRAGAGRGDALDQVFADQRHRRRQAGAILGRARFEQIVQLVDGKASQHADRMALVDQLLQQAEMAHLFMRVETLAVGRAGGVR